MNHKASPRVFHIRRAAQLLVLLACLLANTGCYYYKSVGHDQPATRQKKFCKELKSAFNADKYVIVHQGNNSWHLTNMVIDLPDRRHCSPAFKVIYGSLENVDSLTAFYYNKYQDDDRRALRYLLHDEQYVISQVHVYIDESTHLPAESVSVPLSSIRRVEVYKRAVGRTSWSWAMVNICVDILLSSGRHGHHHKQHAVPEHTPNVHYGPRGR